jgi:MFS family permease
LQSVREGLAFAIRRPVILSIFLVDLVAMIFGMPRAVFPALAERTFHGGAGILGLLYAAPAAGALISALTTGWVTRIRRQGLAVILSVAAWGAAITLAGLTLFSLILTLVFLAVAGGADVVSAVFRGTMLQDATPDALRGRLNALNIMVVTGGPRLGDFEAGLVAGAFGAPASIVIGGLACLLGTGVLSGMVPAFRRYKGPSVSSEEGP